MLESKSINIRLLDWSLLRNSAAEAKAVCIAISAGRYVEMRTARGGDDNLVHIILEEIGINKTTPHSR